jgi:transcriptional regulator with XRE-family HTH domain
MYNFIPELLENLKAEMIVQHGSVKSFCEANNIDRKNLSKVFLGRQNISVSLYLKICQALGVSCSGHDIPETYKCTLAEYLRFDHDAIIKSILKLTLEV